MLYLFLASIYRKILKILSSGKQDLKAGVLDTCCTYFLHLSIGMHGSIFVRVVGIPSVVSFHKLSLLPGLGRTLEYFTSCLACLFWG
jgi:hypothetical protein